MTIPIRRNTTELTSNVITTVTRLSILLSLLVSIQIYLLTEIAMISVRIFLVFSIILLGLLSTSQGIPKKERKLFWNFYKKPDKVFDVVYALSQLDNGDRIRICSNVSKFGISSAGYTVDLVYVDPRSKAYFAEEYPIPTFKCTKDDNTEFYVSYSENDTFFPLIQFRDSQGQSSSGNGKIICNVVSPIVIKRLFGITFSNIRERVLRYFESFDYKERSGYLLEHHSHDKLVAICRLFPSNFDDESKYQTERNYSPMIIHGVLINTGVPSILCKPKGNDYENTFKVYHYYDNIYFKGGHEYDLRVSYGS